MPLLTAAVFGFRAFLGCDESALTVLPPEGSRDNSRGLLPVGGIYHKNGRWGIRFTVEFKPSPNTISPRIEVLYEFVVTFTPNKVLFRCSEEGRDRELNGTDFAAIFESIFVTTKAIFEPSGPLTGTDGQLVAIGGFRPPAAEPEPGVHR